MACDLSTVQAAACESGIGKIQSHTALLQIIAQLLCQLGSAPVSDCEMLEGAGSPVGAQTPDFIGQLYHDTDADSYWRSTGLTSADWVEISGGGGETEGFTVGPLTSTVASIEWTGDDTFTDGIITTGQSYTEITFNGITEVDDVSVEDGDLVSASFPTLTQINNSLTFNNSDDITSVSFPLLASVGGDILFSSMASLTSLSFPSLTSTSGLLEISLDALTTLDFSALETASQNYDINCTVLPTINFNSLTEAAELALEGCPALVSLSFPSLTTLNGDLFVQGVTTITTITAPLLTDSGTVALADCTALASVSFPALTTVSGSFECGNTALVSLSLPSLVTITGNFITTGTASLTSISVPNGVPTDGTLIDCSNCALDAASVNQILARCVAAAVTTCTIDLSGGTNAAPTGQGLVDKADLITAGNTVNTN